MTAVDWSTMTLGDYLATNAVEQAQKLTPDARVLLERVLVLRAIVPGLAPNFAMLSGNSGVLLALIATGRCPEASS